MKPSAILLYTESCRPPEDELLEQFERAAHRAGLDVEVVGGWEEGPFPAHSAADRVGVVLGGDGTILRGLDLFMEQGIPSFGINMGHLGYLASAEPDEIDTVMNRLAGGDYLVDLLPVLTGRMPDGSGIRAINDICLNRALSGGMLHLLIHSGEEPIARIAGDGVVISTPVGSTAYALSAGGPILDPGLPAILMVPLCAHQLAIRPIVFPPESVLTVTASWLRGDGPVVSADGRPVMVLEQDSAVRIELSGGHCPVIRFRPGNGFYEKLGRKFGWGVRG